MGSCREARDEGGAPEGAGGDGGTQGKVRPSLPARCPCAPWPACRNSWVVFACLILVFPSVGRIGRGTPRDREANMGFTPCVSRSRVRAGLPCSCLLFSEERWRLLLASREALPFHRCVKHFFGRTSIIRLTSLILYSRRAWRMAMERNGDWDSESTSLTDYVGNFRCSSERALVKIPNILQRSTNFPLAGLAQRWRHRCHT